MLGSEVLDVAIGLVLVYLLLSMFATALREAVEAVVKSRAVLLERGIREMLNDPLGSGYARWLYTHPLIFSLYRGEFVGVRAGTQRKSGGNLPTYIPAKTLSMALVDLIVRGPADQPYGQLQTAPLSFEALRAAVARIPSAHVQRSLLIALDEADGDLAKARTAIEQWFDHSMERVTGWYRRRSQFWMLLIGVVSTVALNVNTITIAQHLARSKAARELVVGYADRVVADSAVAAAVRGTAPAPADTGLRAREARAVADLQARMAALDSLSLPIGWDRVPPVGSAPVSWFLQQVVGLAITALAVMLGASFWFDALNKVVIVRSTLKPKDTSATRTAGPAGSASVAPATDPNAGMFVRSAGLRSPDPIPIGAMGTAAAGRSATTPPFEPHRWTTGQDADEGVL